MTSEICSYLPSHNLGLAKTPSIQVETVCQQEPDEDPDKNRNGLHVRMPPEESSTYSACVNRLNKGNFLYAHQSAQLIDIIETVSTQKLSDQRAPFGGAAHERCAIR
jgi:hypothetical protein